jgi:hypothetical protein
MLTVSKSRVKRILTMSSTIRQNCPRESSLESGYRGDPRSRQLMIQGRYLLVASKTSMPTNNVHTLTPQVNGMTEKQYRSSRQTHTRQSRSQHLYITYSINIKDG